MKKGMDANTNFRQAEGVNSRKNSFLGKEHYQRQACPRNSGSPSPEDVTFLHVRARSGRASRRAHQLPAAVGGFETPLRG